MADGEEGMAVALRRRRFTLDEYHRMGETGILGENDRVELIEGSSLPYDRRTKLPLYARTFSPAAFPDLALRLRDLLG